MYEVLHLFYNVLPRLLKLCHKKGGRDMTHAHTHIIMHTLIYTEQEQSLLSINEKYAEENDDKTSPLGELKAVLVRYYPSSYMYLS